MRSFRSSLAVPSLAGVLGLLFWWWFTPPHRPGETGAPPSFTDLFQGRWRAELLRVEVIDPDPGVQRLAHTGFEIGYQEDWEQPRWTAYRRQATQVLGRAIDRPSFRRDGQVFTMSASAADYRHSGYDRGHLTPSQDMSWSEASYRDSYYYSNVSPQLPSFNRGPWRVLEQEVRKIAENADACWVVTGPLVSADPERIGPHGVAVPKAFFKAILWWSAAPPKWHGQAWLASHRADLDKPTPCSIDRVEQLSGLDLFAALPDALEVIIEGGSTMD